MGGPIVLPLVAGSRLARELAHGCVRLTGCELAIDDPCELLVQTATHQLRLVARVTAVDGHGGADVELVGFDAALAALIEELAQTAIVPDIGPALDVVEDPAPLTVSFVRKPDAPPPAVDAEPAIEDPAPADDPEDLLELAPALEAEVTDAEVLELADEMPAPTDGEPEPPEGRRKLALNLHERLRGLTLAQQVKKANSADPSERMMLERMYGKNVWEPLLRNPRLTPPEVARIARMGMLPRVMIEVIVGNGAWLQVPEVRRALLANPRLGTDQILRVLRLLPKHELKLASVQTAYPVAVRDAAKRMLRTTGS